MSLVYWIMEDKLTQSKQNNLFIICDYLLINLIKMYYSFSCRSRKNKDTFRLRFQVVRQVSVFVYYSHVTWFFIELSFLACLLTWLTRFHLWILRKQTQGERTISSHLFRQWSVGWSKYIYHKIGTCFDILQVNINHWTGLCNWIWKQTCFLRRNLFSVLSGLWNRASVELGNGWVHAKWHLEIPLLVNYICTLFQANTPDKIPGD